MPWQSSYQTKMLASFSTRQCHGRARRPPASPLLADPISVSMHTYPVYIYISVFPFHVPVISPLFHTLVSYHLIHSEASYTKSHLTGIQVVDHHLSCLFTRTPTSPDSSFRHISSFKSQRLKCLLHTKFRYTNQAGLPRSEAPTLIPANHTRVLWKVRAVARCLLAPTDSMEVVSPRLTLGTILRFRHLTGVKQISMRFK